MKMEQGNIYRSKFYTKSLLVFIKDCNDSEIDAFFFDLTTGLIVRDAKSDCTFIGLDLEKKMLIFLMSVACLYDGFD